MSTLQVSGCRSCGANGLTSILDLGCIPLANALLTAEQLAEPEEKYPLNLVYCRSCTLVQITHTVPSERLFCQYFYFSSASDTLLSHAKELVERLITLRQLNERSLVVEIGSNDGYLLQYYQRAGIPVLGFEPAKNVARVAQEERGIPSLNEFFGAEAARRLKIETGGADIIHAHNVLGHVADLSGFVAGIRSLLKDSGVAVIEVPYVRDMIERCEFDVIYHEHLCYFSLASLVSLFRRHGMGVTAVEHLSIHGGTLRVFVRRDVTTTAIMPNPIISLSELGPSVLHLLQEESLRGVNTLQFFSGFEADVQQLGAKLTKLLHNLEFNGKRIAAYGASAKGSILLNHFGIDKTIIDYVVDRCELKQGHYTPGTHLLIHDPKKLIEDMPDYVLLLAWTYVDEILDQQHKYLRRGGRFIVPIPELRIVESDQMGNDVH